MASSDYNDVVSSVIFSVDEETFSFRWSIHKSILANFKKKVNLLKSPEFTGRKMAQLSWRIILRQYNSAANVYSKPCVTLDLQLTKGKKSVKGKLLVSMQFSILDENDKPISVKGLEDNFVEYNGNNSAGTMWEKSLFHNGVNGVIRNDHFNIHCRIWVRAEKELINKVELTMNHNSLLSQTLRDFRKLLKSTDYSDVVIATPTKVFKAHKSILSARSSVFAAMFQSDMIEAASGKIAISDFPDNVIQEMLNFIYSGGVENMKDNEMELLRIADKYDIQDLKSECTQRVLSTLTCANATEILLVVDSLNIVALKDDIIDFITKNARAVKATTGFKNINAVDPDVFGELISAMLEKLA